MCGRVLHLMTRLCSCARLERYTFRRCVLAAISYTTEKRGVILRRRQRLTTVAYHNIMELTECMHWAPDACREGSLFHRDCPAYCPIHVCRCTLVRLTP